MRDVKYPLTRFVQHILKFVFLHLTWFCAKSHYTIFLVLHALQNKLKNKKLQFHTNFEPNIAQKRLRVRLISIVLNGEKIYSHFLFTLKGMVKPLKPYDRTR
jgi:hypothetical protein